VAGHHRDTSARHAKKVDPLDQREDETKKSLVQIAEPALIHNPFTHWPIPAPPFYLYFYFTAA